MPAPTYSAEDFRQALLALLPPGRAWPREPSALIPSALLGLCGVYERGTADANALLQDSFPATAVDMLPEWESTLGLPDPVLGYASTLQGRRAQVVSKLTGLGGQSIPYYQQVAASLGYAITVSEFAPFRCGQSRAGHHVGSQDWHFTWSVNAAQTTVTRFSAGRSGAGEPLGAWGNSTLQEVLSKIAPAHTVLQFHYS